MIIDLEDGVAAADKEAARTALVETPLDPARTVVRVSPVGTSDLTARTSPRWPARSIGG